MRWAGRNGEKLIDLLDRIEPSQPAMRKNLQQLRAAVERESKSAMHENEVEIPPAFQVLIECRDEAEQQAVYERLVEQGLDCRLLML